MKIDEVEGIFVMFRMISESPTGSDRILVFDIEFLSHSGREIKIP
jgi:hypothetical protein